MNIISALLIFSCLFLLGSSRLRVAIRIVAMQGVLLGLLPIIMSLPDFHPGMWTLGLGSLVSKGIILPWLMSVTVRHSGVRRVIEPFIGFGTSMLLGVVLLMISAWITVRMQLASGDALPVSSVMAFFLVFVGLFLMVSRRNAITQSLAYLVMENGVYAVGISIGHNFPLTVELGVLLDVVVGVFLMGNLLFHLDQEFDHIYVDKLVELSETTDEEIAPVEESR